MMMRFYFLLLFCFLASFSATAQTTALVYPVFDRFEDFRDAYVAPEGNGFIIGSCSSLYRTTDGGASWAAIDLSEQRLSPSNVQCVPGTNCAEVFLSTNRGLYRSEDGGNSWSSSFNRQMPRLDFSQPNLIVGYRVNGREIYQSADGGLNWTTTPLPESLTHNLQVVSPTNYVMIGDSSFFRTTDGGTTWEETYQFDTKTALITTDTDGNHYVETRTAGIYKSTDGGTTWEQKTADAHQYTSFNDLYKDAEDSLHVISFNGVRFSSGDDGVTWGRVGGVRFQRYSSWRRAEGQLIAAGDGLTLLVGNADYTGMNALVTDRLIDFREITFYDADTGYAFGEDGEVVRTTDGGASWSLVSEIGDWMGSRPKIAPNGAIYGVLRFTNFARSTDQGETWSELNAANQALEGGRRVFDVLPNGEVVVMTNQRTVRLDANNTVIFAEDGGHPSTSGGTFDLKMINKDLGFIIRWARLEIYRTTDAGITWDTIPAFGGNNFFNWFEVEDENTFAIGNGSGAWRSTDAGLTWTALPNELALGRFSIGTDQYGYNRTSLFRVREGSTFWESMLTSCAQPLDMVRRPGTNEIFLAYRNGIERIDIDALLSPVFQARPQARALKSWPNPTSGNVYVELPIGAFTVGDLSVVDLTGRRVEVPVSRNGAQLRLQMQHLKPGCYFLRYTSADGELHQARVIRR